MIGNTSSEACSHNKKQLSSIVHSNHTESSKTSENRACSLQEKEIEEREEKENELGDDDIAMYIENESIEKALKLSQIKSGRG